MCPSEQDNSTPPSRPLVRFPTPNLRLPYARIIGASAARDPGPGAAAFPTLARFSNAQLFGLLAVITLVFAGLAAVTYNYFDRIAREKGLIDAQFGPASPFTAML